MRHLRVKLKCYFYYLYREWSESSLRQNSPFEAVHLVSRTMVYKEGDRAAQATYQPRSGTNQRLRNNTRLVTENNKIGLRSSLQGQQPNHTQCLVFARVMARFNSIGMGRLQHCLASVFISRHQFSSVALAGGAMDLTQCTANLATACTTNNCCCYRVATSPCIGGFDQQLAYLMPT